MNKVQVRCWRLEQSRPGTSEPDHLLITYPEENAGHSLITCLKCGAVFAVTIAKEVYVGPPLEAKLKTMHCSTCGLILGGNSAAYPETYVINGTAFTAHRPFEIPRDEDSLVEEFEGIYE
jgi:hypothetical protein